MQKWMFVRGQSPENAALRDISLKRMVGLLDVTPEEMKQIEEGEKQVAQAPKINPGGQGTATPGTGGGEEQALQQEIQQKLSQLSA
jgi:hypothetical protein